MDLTDDRPAPRVVTAEQLIAAERAQRYKLQLQRPEVFPALSNWQYIIENRMAVLAPELYRKFLVSWETAGDTRCEYHENAIKFFPQFLEAIDRADAVAVVYSDISSSPAATVHLINTCSLFDAPRLVNVLRDGDIAFVADCLGAMQPEYSRADLRQLENLYALVSNARPRGEIRDMRMIFGRETRYICPNGHSNSSDVDYCTVCGLNIYGLTDDQNTAVNDFGARISVLARLLK